MFAGVLPPSPQRTHGAHRSTIAAHSATAATDAARAIAAAVRRRVRRSVMAQKLVLFLIHVRPAAQRAPCS
jgi:hypothetical protein